MQAASKLGLFLTAIHTVGNVRSRVLLCATKGQISCLAFDTDDASLVARAYSERGGSGRDGSGRDWGGASVL